MSLRTVLAAAALVADGRVLLAHRHPHRRWYPDCWDLVGGHVEAGESPQEAIVRECREELGIRIEDPRPFPLAVSDTTLEMHAFVVTRWAGTPRNAEPDEHDDLGWFTAQELADLKLADAGGLSDIVAAIEFARAG